MEGHAGAARLNPTDGEPVTEKLAHDPGDAAPVPHRPLVAFGSWLSMELSILLIYSAFRLKLGLSGGENLARLA